MFSHGRERPGLALRGISPQVGSERSGQLSRASMDTRVWPPTLQGGRSEKIREARPQDERSELNDDFLKFNSSSEELESHHSSHFHLRTRPLPSLRRRPVPASGKRSFHTRSNALRPRDVGIPSCWLFDSHIFSRPRLSQLAYVLQRKKSNARFVPAKRRRIRR